MRPRGRWIPAVAAVAILVAGACDGAGRAGAANRAVVTTDTADPALIQPGTILRFGPATDEALEGPLYPPVVAGAEGQLSIFEGYFVPDPCARGLQVNAERGDTITVRVIAIADTARSSPCPDEAQPLGYSMLVGQFEPATYAVRLIHEGDNSRATPLDTVFPGITVKPTPR